MSDKREDKVVRIYLAVANFEEYKEMKTLLDICAKRQIKFPPVVERYFGITYIEATKEPFDLPKYSNFLEEITPAKDKTGRLLIYDSRTGIQYPFTSKVVDPEVSLFGELKSLTLDIPNFPKCFSEVILESIPISELKFLFSELEKEEHQSIEKEQEKEQRRSYP